jgi:glutamate-5-semialdehyde dehydrogenase
MFVSSADPADLITRAKIASGQLYQTPIQVRDQALKALAQSLKEQRDNILEANTLDLETTRDLAVSNLGLKWLKLTPERLNQAWNYIERLATLPDPTCLGFGCHGAGGGILKPFGAVCSFYEWFPEFPIFVSGLCLKTGNSLLIRGTAETNYTHQRLAESIVSAINQTGVVSECFHSLPSDRGLTVREWCSAGVVPDLVIPYGRPSFVQDICGQVAVPVLRPVIGNCYLFWSATGSSDLVKSILLDSHQGMPDAVNAIEKVLIPNDIPRPLLTLLWNSLREKGFDLYVDEALQAEFPEMQMANATDWNRPYLRKAIAFKSVDSLSEAIAWINVNSSGHADCLVTESQREGQLFAQGTHSATLYINATPTFVRLTGGEAGMPALGMMGKGSLRSGSIGLQTLLRPSHVVAQRT